MATDRLINIVYNAFAIVATRLQRALAPSRSNAKDEELHWIHHAHLNCPRLAAPRDYERKMQGRVSGQAGDAVVESFTGSTLGSPELPTSSLPAL